MKRTMRMLRNGLGLLLLLALAASAAWLIFQSRPRPPQAAGSPLPTPTAVRSPTPSRSPSPTARQPGPPASPTPVATQVGQRVPFCAFPGGEPPERGGPGLDKYDFSEPRVVLTSTGSIAIAEWLPDNNRLLVTNSYPYTYHERIETVDIRTGEIQLYAERDHHANKPVWLSAIRGVAYYGIIDNVRLALSVSRGQPSDTETLAVVEGYASGLGAELPVEPGGRYLMYLVDRVGGRPQVWDSVGRATQAAAFAVAEWRDFPYPEYIQRARPRWSPNGAQLAVAVYPFLFLVEPGPQRVCEVSLGSVAGVPRSTVNSSWSPNGRYLAMITTATLPGELVRSTSLGVLDVLTGEQRQIVLPSNLGNIADISWGPNSRHLLALIQAARQQERSDHKLFLVDAVTGDVRAMLPKRAFGGGSNWGEQMTWSPNGQTIALKCPVRFEPEREIKEDRVCLIAAKSQP